MTYIPQSAIPTVTTVVGLSFDVEAGRARVWQALTQEVEAWWPVDMKLGVQGSRMSFEARLGGTLSEQWGDGAGAVWYTVIALDPGRTLDLCGNVTPRFGGPAISQLHVALADIGTATRIQISDGVIGPQRADLPRRVAEGWSQVFGKSLKRYLETGLR